MQKKYFVLSFILLTSLVFSYGSKPKEETSREIKEYNLGIKEQNRKNYSAAITHYWRAVEIKKNFPEAWNNLGYSYRMMAKLYLNEAENAYDQALKYDPNLAGALEYQGGYYLMVGEIKNAYENYKKLLNLNPKEARELKESLDRVLKEAQNVLKEYNP